MVDAEIKICMICKKEFDRVEWTSDQSKTLIVKATESICPDCRKKIKELIK